MQKVVNIGLLGSGTVGSGVIKVLEMNQRQITERVGAQIKLKTVLVRDTGKQRPQLANYQVTADINDIINDPEIDVVVELMGGLHPAYEFVRAAMEAGKNIVTSNKALVAAFYDDLIPLAREKGLKFRCTAAVGGGIGWLSELERARRVQTICQVRGIMNGTCNYILDSMTRLGLGYDQALKQAQALGYAEARPATDVEGIDTWHKAILSSNIAFGVSVDREQVPVAGIHTITAAADGRAWRNGTGNPGMATGGSGDVLSGILLGLLGQGVPPLEAAACGAWLHGKAGDLCADEIGQYGMLPTDMLSHLPRLLK